MQQAEKNYMDLASLGAKPDELSLVLPQSTAAEFCITANIREWNTIFGLRAVGHSRPCVKQIMQQTLELFHKEIPIVFDDVYNKMMAERQR
jgi:thymidylate synthase ThyX